MMMKSEIGDQVSYDVIGCAMRVHATLGPGFMEKIYQRSLAIEMNLKYLNYIQERNIEIFYGKTQIGMRRVDFFVEGRILVEIKSVSKLDDLHITQTMNYCEAAKLPIGLLINFGSKSLEYRRIYNINHPENRKS